jgi:hypothetical protein
MIAETPTQTVLNEFRPGRLWSLWDMLKFKAADFYRVTTAIQGTITALDSRKAKSIEENPDGGVTITSIDDRVFLRVMQSRCDELDESLKDLHASLDAVKNPWRNSTMHVEKKYTDDEAQHIFAAVKGFMKKLAARMDENGEPKA